MFMEMSKISEEKELLILIRLEKVTKQFVKSLDQFTVRQIEETEDNFYFPSVVNLQRSLQEQGL